MAESRQILRTKKLICDSLVALMKQRSFDDITVLDICDNAMLTRATFYKYYEDKYHLLKSIIQDYKENILDLKLKDFVYATPKQLYLKIAQLSLDFIAQNEQDFCLFLKHSNSNRFGDMLISMINGYIEEFLGAQLQSQTFKVPVPVLSRFLTGGLVYSGLYFIENKGKYSKEQILNYIESMIDFGPFAID